MWLQAVGRHYSPETVANTVTAASYSNQEAYRVFDFSKNLKEWIHPLSATCAGPGRVNLINYIIRNDCAAGKYW